MNPNLPIQHQVSLKNFNTFGIEARAQSYLRVTDVSILQEVREDAALAGMPRLVLGGGSNILLRSDFPGLVLHMSITGISIVREDSEARYVRASAGENWHQFVLWTLANGFGGLENLSLIPGSVGAAPIQNIGAYGVEVKDVVDAVSVFDFDSGKVYTLSKQDCAFAYRDSVFKHGLRDRAVIVDVTFKLPKDWQPNTHYAELGAELGKRAMATPNAQEISDAVVAIRQRKLPDPAKVGNAGSFFKNPLVPAQQRNELLARFPQLVSYVQADGSYKLAAGWLIEQCGWKGRSRGAAGVYEKQALVLVNRGGARGEEIWQLGQDIRESVDVRFGVQLEAEPVVV